MKTFKNNIIVDNQDYEMLRKYSWCIAVNGYAVTRNRDTGKVIYMHRLLLNNPQVVDHINGNKLDNRRVNLRACTAAENSRNQRIRSNNTSGFKGVSLDKRRSKWHAYIRINYTRKHLGYFDTPEEAYEAYLRGAVKYHKEFAHG